MSAHIIGYARMSTKEQYLSPPRTALDALGVPADRIYVNHGLSGRNRERAGSGEVFAAIRTGDTLLVTKLDRLARSLPDAGDIIEDLTKRSVKLGIGGSIRDPTDPVGLLLFNVLAMVATSSPAHPRRHAGRQDQGRKKAPVHRHAAQANGTLDAIQGGPPARAFGQANRP
ncbi:recombinase family protein [Arthrobacter sp. ES3-54]|uniref:recombinase family protein n=1 Tax=Arthrobacter sp. ES3-54 TaxID=1502991 RepID=UPI00321789D0|nr:DNA invertase Pin-like site-specific DNA recombinase [Arthrobacter sp. ES3-54]